jgi:WD40 repeat protein
VAVLADGRVVTGDGGGRVLIWDPARPGADPVELGSHHGGVTAVAVLADGRVVTGGGDRRVLIWDPARPSTQVIQLSCSLTTLATAPSGPSVSSLAIAHEGGGLSLWSVTG